MVLMTELSRVFTPENQFKSTRHQVMQLKTIWTGRQISNVETDLREALVLQDKISIMLQKRVELEKIIHLNNKGLMFNPKLHFFYALKGEFHLQKYNNWSKAIKSYQEARILSRGQNEYQKKYKKKLINVYYNRASNYLKNEEFMKVLADYEEILMLNPEENMKLMIQDKILDILRLEENYIAYRFCWSTFINLVNAKRASDLFTQHAEYKIDLKDVTVARSYLFNAIKLDKKNLKAQNLLQDIFLIGDSMMTLAIIWCSYGCYDKALIAIEKARDCDPCNSEYSLLKVIVLKLSHQPAKAIEWLKTMDENCYKIKDPKRNLNKSSQGYLTIGEIKSLFIQEWNLTRYDLAVELMIRGQYQVAVNVLQDKYLLQIFAETHTLLGDCYQKMKKPISALESYINSYEKHQELKSLVKDSKKYLHLMQRLASLIFSDTFRYSESKRIDVLTTRVLGILVKEKIDLCQVHCQQ